LYVANAEIEFAEVSGTVMPPLVESQSLVAIGLAVSEWSSYSISVRETTVPVELFTCTDETAFLTGGDETCQ
jgi:hypothetical protein